MTDGSQPAISVLVVEDDLGILIETIAALQESGLSTHEASDAKTAILRLEESPEISVLFTDIDMPGTMDGLALASYARGRWPSLGIILATGYRWDATANMPDRTVFMSKPYQHHAVVEQIRQMTELV